MPGDPEFEKLLEQHGYGVKQFPASKPAPPMPYEFRDPNAPAKAPERPPERGSLAAEAAESRSQESAGYFQGVLQGLLGYAEAPAYYAERGIRTIAPGFRMRLHEWAKAHRDWVESSGMGLAGEVTGTVAPLFVPGLGEAGALARGAMGISDLERMSALARMYEAAGPGARAALKGGLGSVLSRPETNLKDLAEDFASGAVLGGALGRGGEAARDAAKAEKAAKAAREAKAAETARATEKTTALRQQTERATATQRTQALERAETTPISDFARRGRFDQPFTGKVSEAARPEAESLGMYTGRRAPQYIGKEQDIRVETPRFQRAPGEEMAKVAKPVKPPREPKPARTPREVSNRLLAERYQRQRYNYLGRQIRRSLAYLATSIVTHGMHLPHVAYHGIAHTLEALASQLAPGAARRVIEGYAKKRNINPGGPLGHYLTQLAHQVDPVLEPLQQLDPSPSPERLRVYIPYPGSSDAQQP